MKNCGKVKELILNRSIKKPLQHNGCIYNKSVSVGTDCAFFNDSATGLGYVAYKYKRAVELAIVQGCNNLWVSKAKPEIVFINLSLPETYKEIRIKEITAQVIETAKNNNLKVAGGHTEYVPGLKNPIISVVVQGKIIKKDCEYKYTKDLDIVMTKYMGISGTAVIASEKQEELTKKLPKSYVMNAAALGQLISVAPEVNIAIKDEATICMHDVAGGGVFTALWELGEKLNCGLQVNLKEIPVKQETIEVCEYYDINPYKIRGDGSILVATSNGEKLVETLLENGINAKIVGRTTECIDRIIVRDDERRFLEPGNGDEINSIIW